MVRFRVRARAMGHRVLCAVARTSRQMVRQTYTWCQGKNVRWLGLGLGLELCYAAVSSICV